MLQTSTSRLGTILCISNKVSAGIVDYSRNDFAFQFSFHQELITTNPDSDKEVGKFECLNFNFTSEFFNDKTTKYGLRFIVIDNHDKSILL